MIIEIQIDRLLFFQKSASALSITIFLIVASVYMLAICSQYLYTYLRYIMRFVHLYTICIDLGWTVSYNNGIYYMKKKYIYIWFQTIHIGQYHNLPHKINSLHKIDFYDSDIIKLNVFNIYIIKLLYFRSLASFFGTAS